MRIRVVGNVEPELLERLENAGFEVEAFLDALEVEADEIEGLRPVLLPDVGRYTARGLVKGLKRDIQATQRFFLRDPLARDRDSDASEQELRALIDFTQAVSRSLAKAEIVDAATRFLYREAACPAVAIHLVTKGGGLEGTRAIGLTDAELKALTRYLEPLVREDSPAFRQGIHFDRSPGIPPPPVPLSALVPVLAKDDLLGVLSARLNPHVSLSPDTLKAMARQLALSLQNGDLLARTEAALSSLRRAQQSMGQSEKLAAVGLLAAGIAHEINNPASFIITNLTVLGETFADLLGYIDGLEALAGAQADREEELSALRERHDVDYLRRDTPDLIARSLKGMQRIHDIVRDLRSFAHKGGGRTEWVDINQVISQVLKMAGAELRHRARVELDLRPVPKLEIESTPLSQVLLNLIINAYQAFGERPKAENMVWVGSRTDDHSVRIYVADNGPGMTQETRDRIFEPFFTTKPVGTGTGLGLAVSYELVKKMGGRIHIESTPGRGSRFTVELPVK